MFSLKCWQYVIDLCKVTTRVTTRGNANVFLQNDELLRDLEKRFAILNETLKKNLSQEVKITLH